MRSKLVLAALALLAIAPAWAQEQEKPKLPRPAPEINLKDTKGKTWKLETLEKDKVYLIEFWATWCTTCKEIAPMISEVVKEHRGEKFEMLSISIDENPRLLVPYLKENPQEHPLLMDSKLEAAERWGALAVPALFVVKNGQIVNQWVGKLKKEELVQAIEAAQKAS